MREDGETRIFHAGIHGEACNASRKVSEVDALLCYMSVVHAAQGKFEHALQKPADTEVVRLEVQ